MTHEFNEVSLAYFIDPYESTPEDIFPLLGWSKIPELENFVCTDCYHSFSRIFNRIVIASLHMVYVAFSYFST